MLLGGFTYHHFSLLSTISTVKTDIIKCAQALKKDVKYLRIFVFNLMKCVFKNLRSIYRGGFRTAATSTMEHFVILVNGFQPLTVIT